jgi:hypothetical protein
MFDDRVVRIGVELESRVWSSREHSRWRFLERTDWPPRPRLRLLIFVETFDIIGDEPATLHKISIFGRVFLAMTYQLIYLASQNAPITLKV